MFIILFPTERSTEIPLIIQRQTGWKSYNRRPLKSIYRHWISQFSGIIKCIMRNTDALIGMRIQPPQIGIFAELESILQVQGKWPINFLPLCIIAFKETVCRSYIARTNVKTDLMDEGMVGAVIRLSDRFHYCLSVQFVADCWKQQQADYIQRPSGIHISTHLIFSRAM